MSTNFPGIHTLNPPQFEQLLDMVQSSDAVNDIELKELFDESIAFKNLKASFERSADIFIQECLSTAQYDKGVALLKRAPPFNAAMLLQTLFARALTRHANGDSLLDRIQIERTVRFAMDWVQNLEREPAYRAHIGDLKERLNQAQRGLITHCDSATVRGIGEGIIGRVEAVKLAILESIDQNISAAELPYKSEAEKEAEENQRIEDLRAGREVAPYPNSILLPSGRCKPATDLEMVVANPNQHNSGERFEQLLAFLLENHSSTIGAIVTALLADPHNEAFGRQIMSQFETYLIPLFSQSKVTFSKLFECGFPIEMGPSMIYKGLINLQEVKRRESKGEAVPLSYERRLEDILWYIQFLHDAGKNFLSDEDSLEGRPNLYSEARNSGLDEVADLLARLIAERAGFSPIQRV